MDFALPQNSLEQSLLVHSSERVGADIHLLEKGSPLHRKDCKVAVAVVSSAHYLVYHLVFWWAVDDLFVITAAVLLTVLAVEFVFAFLLALVGAVIVAAEAVVVPVRAVAPAVLAGPGAVSLFSRTRRFFVSLVPAPVPLPH